MIGKQKIEAMCRNARMYPVHRGTIDGVEIFIADGFSRIPDITYHRLGVGTGNFPNGCFATLWWAAKGDEKLDTGQPMFFDVNHDLEYSDKVRQRGRINAALIEARSFLQRRKLARLH